MDSDSIIMLLVMIALVALSAFFSATETAFSSFNRIRMKSLSTSGNTAANKVLALDEEYDKLITSVLIGNNIVNITLTTVATLFFIKVIPHLSSDMTATISTVIITVVVLIFGEITPKTLAKEHADSYVLSTYKAVSFFIKLLFPFTLIFAGWRKLITKIFKTKAEDITTEDDLITLVDEAEQDGGLDEDESELIRSAIVFSDLTAGEILTPRIDMVSITENTDFREILMVFFDSGFSRIPVIGESIDDIKGVLHEKDFFYAYSRGQKDLREYYHKPLFVSKHEKIDELLKDLQNEKCHMAFVIDEFGGLLGIVTMEDIIEELIGEVWDEHDEIETPFIENEDGSLTVDSSAELDDLLDRFDLKFDDENERPQTVNGWLQLEFEGLPDEGDEFVYQNIKVTVTECDEKMIKEVVVRKLDETELTNKGEE